MATAASEIIRKADKLVEKCGTRDPFKIAAYLGVEIFPCPFEKQRGAYTVIARNRFIFINQNLPEPATRIVLLHELGHDSLHRAEAARNGGFKEYKIFDVNNNRLEYEANLFASQIELDTDTVFELCKEGYDIQQIACQMYSDVNLVAMKVDTMISQGYKLRKQEHRNVFLRYDK